MHAQVESEGLPQEGQNRREAESEGQDDDVGGGWRGAVASGEPEFSGEGKGTVSPTSSDISVRFSLSRFL